MMYQEKIWRKSKLINSVFCWSNIKQGKALLEKEGCNKSRIDSKREVASVNECELLNANHSILHFRTDFGGAELYKIL